MSKKIKNAAQANEAITATTNEVANDTQVLETSSEVTTPAPETTPTVDLKSLMERYPNVSLRKLALSLELSYGWILKCAKKPIAGEAYDPDAINYAEVAKTFARKGINLEELDWESLNESTQTSRGISLQKDMSAFQVGGKVYLREDNEVPFDICYKTDTHIVIMKEGSSEPRAWSHSTFLMKGPVFEPRTTHDNNDPNEVLDETTEETVQDILNDFIDKGEEA